VSLIASFFRFKSLLFEPLLNYYCTIYWDPTIFILEILFFCLFLSKQFDFFQVKFKNFQFFASNISFINLLLQSSRINSSKGLISPIPSIVEYFRVFLAVLKEPAFPLLFFQAVSS